jgi:amiloride-sensitive sodium channel
LKEEKYVNNLTSVQQSDFAAYTQMCREIRDTKFVMDEICNNRSEKNVVRVMKSFDRVDYNYNCAFRGLYVSCSKSYSRSLTDYGICYTFNIQGYHTIFNDGVMSDDFDIFKRTGIPKFLDVVKKEYYEMMDDDQEEINWTLEDGYKTSSDEIMPFRASRQNDFTSNLYVNVSKTEHGILNYCLNIGFGYKIFFHMPNEIPSIFNEQFLLPLHYAKKFTIAAKSFKTSKDLQKFKPVVRGCYFDGEKKLKYFKTYTKSHCDYECMTNITLDLCGCVKFSMPRGHDTPVCDLDKIQCYMDVMASWPSFNNTLYTCDCLSPCSNLEYNIESNKEAIIYLNTKWAWKYK